MNIWCHSSQVEFEVLGAEAEQWYIPARVLPLMHPGVDRIVLPRNHGMVMSWWDFCQRELGLQDNQVLWTSGSHYLLDDDIQAELLPALRAVQEANGASQLIPYSASASFVRWAAQLPGVQVMGDNPVFARRYGDKAVMHALARGGHTPHRELPSEVAIPAGYTCRNTTDLQVAFHRLGGKESDRVVVKPCHGSAGDGIEFLTATDLAEYSFPFGNVLVEEALPVDRDDSGEQVSISVQYTGQELLGLPADQLLHGATFAGVRVPSRTSPKFQRQALEMTQAMLKWMQPKGPGSFDFLSIQGKPVLVDINAGRFSGAHPAKLFCELYAPGQAYTAWKPMPVKSVEELWEGLQQAGIAFSTTSRQGVFPLCWLPGIWAMLIAIGGSSSEVEALVETASALTAD